MKNRDKEKKMLESMSLMDESYVEEAKPKEAKAKKLFPWKQFAYIAVAACLCLAIVLPITLMSGEKTKVPTLSSSTDTAGQPSVTVAVGTEEPATVPSHLQAYKDSPYYPLIEKLDAYYKDREEEKNGDNWDALVPMPEETMSSVATMAPSVGVPDGDSPDLDDFAPNDPEIPDITDNQVAGVVEADRIKRTATHIFYLRGDKLEAYTIAGLDSTCVGSYRIASADCSEFYLLDGGKKILLLANPHSLPSCFNRSGTKLILLDVSDPGAIKEIKTVTVSGYMKTSRVSDGSVLLFTDYYVINTPDYSDPGTFVPVVQDSGVTATLPFEDIIMPETINGTSYGIIYSFNPNTLEIEGNKAFVGGMGVIYVSKNNVYSAITRSEYFDENGRRYTTTMSDIYCFAYGNGSFEQKGKVSVEGFLKDQYSMDEKDGILRVVTTVSAWSYRLPTKPSGSSGSSGSSSSGSVTPGDRPIAVQTTADPFEETAIPVPDTEAPISSEELTPDTWIPVSPLTSYEVMPEISPMASNLTVSVMTTASPTVESKPVYDLANFAYTGASLFCVSLDSFEVVASVERFAPKGETVQSVRFDGDTAYVCTSIVLTDPVFFFDLSDLNNITYTDTGVIEGYSSSLVNFENGNLLGIGFGSGWDKMKIEIYREEGDKVVSVAKFEEIYSFAVDYKSYYIDRQNQLIGMGVSRYEDGGIKERYILLHFDGEKLVMLVEVENKGSPYLHRAVFIDGYFYIFGESGLQVVAVTLSK